MFLGSVQTNFIDQALVSGGNFASVLLLIKVLGLEGFGSYSVIWILVLIVNSLHNAAVIFPMMTLIPKYLDKSKEYFSDIFYAQVAFLISISIIFIPLSYYYLNWAGLSVDFRLLWQFFLIIFFYHTQDFFRKYFLATGSFVFALIIDFIAYGLRFLSLFYFFLMSMSLDLSSALDVVIVCYAIAVVSMLPFVHLTFSRSGICNVFLQHWAMARWLVPSGLMQWSSINMHILLAPTILDLALVGVVRAGQNIIGVLNVGLLAFENILPTLFSRLLVNSGRAKVISLFFKVSIIGSLLMIVLGVALSVFSKPLLYFFYGEELVEYYYVIIWFSLIFLCMYLVIPIRGLLRTLDQTKYWFKAYVVTSIFSLVIFYPCQYYMSIHGVLLGMLLSYVCLLLVAYFSAIRTMVEKIR